VPQQTGLSFLAHRPGSTVKPPVLSKAAQQRQAAKEAANERSAAEEAPQPQQQRPQHDSTPTKRKRADKQPPTTPDSGQGKRRSGKKKHEDGIDNKQANLLSFFSSPQRQTDTNRTRQADDDEGEAEYGASEEKRPKKAAARRKKRQPEAGETIEREEKDERQHVFSTADADGTDGAPQASSKAGKKKASKGKKNKADEEEMADDDNDFVESPSKQSVLGLYASQSDYNRELLETLRQQYQDISQSTKHTAHKFRIRYAAPHFLIILFSLSGVLCAPCSNEPRCTPDVLELCLCTLRSFYRSHLLQRLHVIPRSVRSTEEALPSIQSCQSTT